MAFTFFCLKEISNCIIYLLIVVIVAAILFVQAELDEMTFGILVRLTIVSFTLFINVKRTLFF